MERTYYKADLEDISPGSVIQTQFAGRGDWKDYLIRTMDYEINPVGQNNIGTIITNIQRYQHSELPHYRVSHLHPDDIISFGFSQTAEKSFTKNTTGTMEFEYGRFRLTFNTTTRETELYEEIKRKDGTEIVPLFSGTPLNIYEFGMLLRMTGVLFTEKRNLKFKSNYK